MVLIFGGNPVYHYITIFAISSTYMPIKQKSQVIVIGT